MHGSSSWEEAGWTSFSPANLSSALAASGGLAPPSPPSTAALLPEGLASGGFKALVGCSAVDVFLVSWSWLVNFSCWGGGNKHLRNPQSAATSANAHPQHPTLLSRWHSQWTATTVMQFTENLHDRQKNSGGVKLLH